MKKIIIILISVFAFVTSAQAVSFLSPGGGSLLTPGQWIVKQSLQTITPNPNTLQVPCANIVGGCSSSSSFLGSISAIAPVVYDSSTGQFSFINSNGYITTSTNLTVANFLSPNISQWTNDSGYITTSTFNATGTANYFSAWNSTGNRLSSTSSIYQTLNGDIGINTTTATVGDIVIQGINGSSTIYTINGPTSSGTPAMFLGASNETYGGINSASSTWVALNGRMEFGYAGDTQSDNIITNAVKPIMFRVNGTSTNIDSGNTILSVGAIGTNGTGTVQISNGSALLIGITPSASPPINTPASTSLQIAGASSTIRLGTGGINPGCIEMYDSINSSTIDYGYFASLAWIVTSTKPNFCQ